MSIALYGDRLDNCGARVKEALGVEPSYVIRNSLSVERLTDDKAVLRVELRKVISLDEAMAILNGDPIEEKE